MAMHSGWMAAVLLAGSGLASGAHAQCEKNEAGAPVATGEGKSFSAGKTAAQKRLGAERAAHLDALTKLRACLGEEELARVKAVTVSEVRYYDSDPVVEIDVVALSEGPAKFVAVGSAAPATGSQDVQKIRIGASRAALALARRNAREALDAFAPDTEKQGSVRASFEGLLSGCDSSEVSYWDDGAVSLKVECSKEDKPAPVEKPAPAVQKRESGTSEAE